MINLIDRYIAKLFLTYFAASFIVFLTLRVTADATSMSVQYNPSLNSLLSYYIYSLPQMFYEMVPVACLLATIFTLGTMSRAHEITALFSSGMSLARISTPIIVIIALISVAVFAVGDWMIPVFMKKKKYVEYVEIRKQPGMYSTVKTNKIWYRSKNILFNLRTLNPETRLAQGANFYYFDENWNLIELLTARELYIGENHRWNLKDGTVTVFDPEVSFPLTKSYDSKTISIEEELFDLQADVSASDTLRVGELSRFIKKNKEAGLDTLRYEVDYHAKFSFALAGLVMSFLAIPFSIGKARSGGFAWNVGICLGLAFAYWALYSSGLTLGRHGAVSPIVAVWFPNFIMLMLGGFFLLRLKR